jgi:hypothetical protein
VITPAFEDTDTLPADSLEMLLLDAETFDRFELCYDAEHGYRAEVGYVADSATWFESPHEALEYAMKFVEKHRTAGESGEK